MSEMEKDKNKDIITNLSDSDFLSYLYSERNREESLNSYQGWSIWAIVGALITVICTGYAILCKNNNEINTVRLIYLVSGILGFILCYRPYFLFLVPLFRRDRGVDYKKVKFLKDIIPKPYLWSALLVAVGFSVLIPIFVSYSPFNVVTLSWLITTVFLIGAIIYGQKRKDKIVWSVFNGVIFGDRKLDSWFGGVLSGILSVAWLQSFKRVEGGIIGSPDFELAICIVTVIALLYLFIEIKSGEKMSVHMDLLLDDFIYKGIDKKTIYRKILIHRMGYGILEACANELYALQQLFDEFEPQMKKIEEVNALLLNGSFDINRMSYYYDIINSSSSYADNYYEQTEALNEKLDQIGKQVPVIETFEEYHNLLILINILLKKEKEVLEAVNQALKKLLIWIKVYHCKKYGGWCVQDNCSHRNDRKSWSYRIELFKLKHIRHLRSSIKPRIECDILGTKGILPPAAPTEDLS